MANMRYDENMRYMTSHVRHSERGSVISDCLVVIFLFIVDMSAYFAETSFHS